MEQSQEKEIQQQPTQTVTSGPHADINQGIVTFGIRGSGKSYHLKKELNAMNKYIIFDWGFEYKEFGHVIKGKFKYEDFTKHKKIIYQPSRTMDKTQAFDNLCKFLFDEFTRAGVKIMVVVDEAHMVMPQNTCINNKYKYITELITRGRRCGFGYWFVSQRPALIDKTAVVQAAHKIVFRLNANDLQWCKQNIDPRVHDINEKPAYYYYYEGLVNNNPVWALCSPC